jgi:hypothetical protein
MRDRVRFVSEHFGPKLVSIGNRRISFAEAWRDPQLRKRAIYAAQRTLRDEQRAISKWPSPDCDRLAVIADLLLELPLEDGDIG